jgi:hypothetical protein
MKKIPLPSIARRGLQHQGSRIKDCKELLPVVLRISKQLEKV